MLELADPTLLICALVLIGAYLVRGIVGFGSSLLAVPLLAHLLPLSLVVPLMTLLDTLASVLLGRMDWSRARDGRKEIWRLLPSLVLGILLGLVLLQRLAEAWLQFTLGIVILIFGLRALLPAARSGLISQVWAHPAGFSGGVIDALFASGGPAMVIYLSQRIRGPSELRGALSLLFLFSGLSRSLGLLVAGMLGSRELLIALVLGLPLMLAGLWMGNRLHRHLDSDRLHRAIGLVIAVSGVSIGLHGLVML